jgi:hypothetical protein
VNNHKDLYQTLKRTSALSDRITKAICQRIETRTDLKRLDELFTLGQRAHALYRRIHARYEATKPQYLRDLWSD